ncbi:hypothetical protein F5X68DRAFT_262316 [Plectosphaerella plurivora]|uniref:Uncharacterized protein n=1 Tax=Plectosphaerella plurivora TaxID=936078 RepID=A0A9P8V9W8_9PEZI|nr:hypothetical protein F5X68DRAFT_262316 [Plectosphaerella plurivora]
MLDSSTAPAAGPVSSPITESTGTLTGQSNMQALGNRLVASYAPINENGAPPMVHQIDVRVLLAMFKGMYLQLLEPIVSDFDLPIPSILRTSPELESMATSLAYDAAVAAASVCHDKARRLNPMIVRFNLKPSPAFSTFPAYIAALISSMGPIQCGSTTSRWVHVPVIDMTHLQREFPSSYRASHYYKFREQQESKMTFSNIETSKRASSPWWTLWPVEGLCLYSNGPAASGHGDGSDACDDSREWTVFSPVKIDKIDDFLKPAVLFAGRPLSRPGIGACSATYWYDREALRNFAGTTPAPLDFPPETRGAPFFWKNASAFHANVETRWLFPECEGNDDTAPSVTGQRRTQSQMSPDNQAKRRKTVPTSDQNGDDDQDGRIFEYRIVYHSFDHVSLQDIKPSAYKNFISEACKST